VDSAEIALLRGGAEPVLDYLTGDSRIREKEKVVTTSWSGEYPEGIVVGEVLRIRKMYRGLTIRASVRPFLSLLHSEHLFVYKK